MSLQSTRGPNIRNYFYYRYKIARKVYTASILTENVSTEKCVINISIINDF